VDRTTEVRNECSSHVNVMGLVGIPVGLGCSPVDVMQT